MVFTTTNLFKSIACPEGEQCRLTSCIFSHDLRPKGGDSQPPKQTQDSPEEPASKRRRIDSIQKYERGFSKSDQIHEQLAVDRQGKPSLQLPKPPPSLEKAVTPPPRSNGKAAHGTSHVEVKDNSGQGEATTKQLDALPKENLNPRLIPNDPVGHQKRTLFLKHMHLEMVRLNKEVAGAKDLPNRHLYNLSEQELIKLALDEEETLARSQSTLYPNKMKQSVAAYKKMDKKAWTSHVQVKIFDKRAKTDKKVDADEKVITTGLPADDECAILPHLVADQTNLAQHGYVTSPPTATEAAEAQAAVEASKNFESCDRCGARFQVFPHRDEEGHLTSGGSCRFHPNRKVVPQKTKNDYNAAAKEPYYPCCNNAVGSKGCTTHESHVFKTSSPARLAAVLPFITTPENLSPEKDRNGKEVKAVSFDCEMGYTTSGMELIRLTAVNWPSGEELVDVLVRPVGTIIDLNSRFSGVFPEHFANAIPYSQWKSSVAPPPCSPRRTDNSPPTQILPVVASVSCARDLLTSYLTPSTPLIGHAIENDLNATRLVHPTIIDTVLLFRHPRGLPFRFGLRALALQHLGKRIQQGGDRGHDSAEDARATGELVRVKVKERWAQLERAGFVVREGQLGRDDGQGGWKVLEAKHGVVDAVENGGGGESGNGKNRGKKRKSSWRYGMDGTTDGDGDEDAGEESGQDGQGRKNGIAAFLPQS